MTTYEGIKRTGPPQAIQKLREDLYMIQIMLSETPTADWKRLFYETQQAPPPDFPPRAVDISGAFIRFRSDVAERGSQDGLDRPLDRPRQSEGSGHGREAGRRTPARREEHQREQQELAAINAHWEKL